MSENKMIKRGDTSPDFFLKDHHSNTIRLSDFKGKKVLLSFHPMAWTKICAEQMKSLEKHAEEFRELGSVAFGISIDTIPSKNAWAKELEIEKIVLLSDFWPHGEVASKYGIFREKEGFSERANIVLDEKHKILFKKIYPLSQTPDIQEILSVLKRT